MSNINKEPLAGQTIVVWFSCGAASAVAAKRTVEKYGGCCTIRVVNNPIKEEDEDNFRFLKDVEEWIGVKIERTVNEKYPSCSAEDVWKDRKYMSGPQGAPCTWKLKKEARQQWEKNNHFDWLVMGFTADEKKRSDNFILSERENLLPVLLNDGLTKPDCFHIIREAGIKLPNMYLLGFPNANCKGCVKAASPTYWNHTRKVFPEVFEERARLSREIGCKLVVVKGTRVFLDELDPETKGRSMKGLDFECGIFCEEHLK